MIEYEIKDVNDLHQHFEKYRKKSNFKFRGQSNIEWELIPKAGRKPYNNLKDINIYSQWKRRAIAYVDIANKTDWELLAIAQHNGLPTRFLDWTHNPLVATFFSSIENEDYDGVVYAYSPTSFLKNEIYSPFELDKQGIKIGFLQPNSSSDRLINQSGYFSVHNDPELALNEKTKTGRLERIIIKKSLKKEIIFMLNQYGVNYLTLFPDLEGLTKHLSWFTENYNYWNSSTLDETDTDVNQINCYH